MTLNMRYLAIVFCLALVPLAHAAEPDWSDYAALLQAHVSPGEKDGLALNRVDYEALRESPLLASAVEQVRNFDVARLKTPEETLAFYINAYNVLTLQLIVERLPLESIRDIGNFFNGPWDIVMLENAAGDLTLDDIEHRIIRSIPEPRIHFAVNCASVSCPDLRTEPYTASKLDEQLDEQARLFLSQEGKGLSIEGNTVRVSKIFGWYDEDFEPAGVKAFVEQYVPAIADKRVRTNLPYNWRLNGE